MTITELISRLEAVRSAHGDLTVVRYEPLEPRSVLSADISTSVEDLFYEESTEVYCSWRFYTLDEPELQPAHRVVCIC